MRIKNVDLYGITIGQTSETVKPESLAGRESADVARPARSFHTPSAEFADWLARLRLEPLTREQAINRVMDLLREGYYDTPKALNLTAEAILAAQD